MASYEDLDNEDAWNDEFAAPALVTLGNQLKAHYPGAGVWIRGDNNHMRGYHRSRRWIRESIYCTDHSYSVTRTSGDVSGGDSNWACGIDIQVDQADLYAMCQRLDAACRAGELEKITEWFGNLGNDSAVDGWDNISNRPASADSSHLTHLHISFDRGRANEDHADVFEILTGVSMQTEGERNVGYYTQNGILGLEEPVVHIPAESGYPPFTTFNPLATAIKALVECTDAHLPVLGNIPQRTWNNGIADRLDQIKSDIAAIDQNPVDVHDLVEQLVPVLVPALVTALQPMIEDVVSAALSQLQLKALPQGN